MTLLFAVKGFEDNCVNDGRWKYSLKACLEQRVLSLYSSVTQQAGRRSLSLEVAVCLAGRGRARQVEKWDRSPWGKRGSRPRGRASDQDSHPLTLFFKPFNLKVRERKSRGWRGRAVPLLQSLTWFPDAQTNNRFNPFIFKKRSFCVHLVLPGYRSKLKLDQQNIKMSENFLLVYWMLNRSISETVGNTICLCCCVKQLTSGMSWKNY